MPTATRNPAAPTPAQAYGELAQRLVPIAADLVQRVHDEGRDSIGHLLATLSPEEQWALPVVLAAMVPPEAPVADLLAWVTWDEQGRPLEAYVPRLPARKRDRGLQPCGTHAAFARHKAHGEPPCQACTNAERDYHARRRRAA